METEKRKIIAVDFDGCLTDNQYPDVGTPNVSLINWLLYRKSCGDRIILWTCRCGDELDAAISACHEWGLEFDSVNDNLPELIEQWGNNTRKIYADIYIDDKAHRFNAHCATMEIPFIF